MFLVFYSLRVVLYISTKGMLAESQTPFYVLAYLIGLTVVPLFVVAKYFRPEHLSALDTYLLVMCACTNILLLAYFTFGGGGDGVVRAQVSGSVAGTAVINPIMVSQMGAVLALMALSRLFFKQGGQPFKTILLMLLVMAGLTNLVLGGSRGPALSFLICFALLIYSLTKVTFWRSPIRMRIAAWLFVFLGVSSVLIYVSTRQETIYIFDRFGSMFHDRQTGVVEARDIIWEKGLHDFAAAPFLGKGYIVSELNMPPHNIILEALMATGVIGFSLFAVALGASVASIWKAINGSGGQGGYVVALVSICFLSTGLVSASIGQFPELWVFLVLVTLITVDTRNAVVQRGCRKVNSI